MNSHRVLFVGAIKKWTDLQASGDNLIVMLADLHAVTIPREPDALRLTMECTEVHCNDMIILGNQS